jgi:hypothetical protein
LVLFIICAIISVTVLILIAGIIFLFSAAAWLESYGAMHSDRHLNIIISAKKTGTSITLLNEGGEPSGLQDYGIKVNENWTSQRLNATPGSQVVINGTTGSDHVVIRECWPWGACQTFLDTSV